MTLIDFQDNILHSRSKIANINSTVITVLQNISQPLAAFHKTCLTLSMAEWDLRFNVWPNKKKAHLYILKSKQELNLATAGTWLSWTIQFVSLFVCYKDLIFSRVGGNVFLPWSTIFYFYFIVLKELEKLSFPPQSRPILN